MVRLSLTFIDVGWGDSILLDAEDSTGNRAFALIDSNDSVNLPSSRIFLKRYFERYVDRVGLSTLPYPLFEFVAASHAHADHVSGLQGVIRQFGAQTLYTPRFGHGNNACLANLLRWASWATRNKIRVVNRHRYLSFPDTFKLGPVDVSVLWPPAPVAGSPNQAYSSDENNNSLVLAFKLNDVCFVSTGDCVADNWTKSKSGTWPVDLPKRGLKMVQVPHHGARNGLFDSSGNLPLLDQISMKHAADTSVEPLMVVSCHPAPHGHPHIDVASELDGLSLGKRFTSSIPGTSYLRTDQNLHFTVSTDGANVTIQTRPAS